MVDLEEGARQLVDILQCDLFEARKILQQCNGDTQRAIEAYFNNSSSTSSSNTQYQNEQFQQTVAPFQSPIGPSQQPTSTTSKSSTAATVGVNEATSGWDSPINFPDEIDTGNAAIQSQQNDATWAERASEGVRRSERNAKKRSSPIDLTGDDEDEDLRKAMQASLESESNRQKRHQEYGLGGKDTIKNGVQMEGISADDEALTRAIEASMLQSSSATRDQTPAFSIDHLESIGGKQMRSDGKPVAILAPLPFMRIFALALQALYASAPFRNALLTTQLTDIRIMANHPSLPIENQLSNYWRGSSPSNITKPTAEQWIKNCVSINDQDGVDGFMRLLTLFTFLTYTKRSIVVAEDVITHSPIRNNYAYVMNSERKPPHDVLACYVQGVLDMLATVSTQLEQRSSTMCDAQTFKHTFQSFTVNAVTPLKEEGDMKHARRPRGDSYEAVVHNLMQTNVNNSVHRALYACLADEKSLYSLPAETLFFCLGRSGQYNPNFASGWQPDQGAGEVSKKFTIEETIYLDSFMYSRRNGVRLGLDTDLLKKRQSKIDELEKYKKSISIHEGDDTRETLRTSIDYFKTLSIDDGSDPLRTSSLNEAGPRLEAILAHLEQEITEVDSQLLSERMAVENERSTILGEFEENLKKTEYQTMPYNLQAILVDDGIDKAWAFVRNSDGDQTGSDSVAKWWRICEGEVTEVKEEDVLGEDYTVTFLVYTATNQAKQVLTELRKNDEMPLDEEKEDREESTSGTGNDWSLKQPLGEAIEYDNAKFGRELAGELSIKTKSDEVVSTADVAVVEGVVNKTSDPSMVG